MSQLLKTGWVRVRVCKGIFGLHYSVAVTSFCLSWEEAVSLMKLPKKYISERMPLILFF